jgi:hypothetical protein
VKPVLKLRLTNGSRAKLLLEDLAHYRKPLGPLDLKQLRLQKQPLKLPLLLRQHV